MAKNEKEKEKENGKDKGNGKKMNPIILVVLLVVGIGVGVFVGTTFISKNNNTAVKHAVEIKVPIAETVTVNLSDEGAKRLVKASVTISYDENNKDLGDEIKEKTVEIKDKTIFYLKSKKAADFNASNETVLKKDLIEEINKLLTTGQIINVYFPGDLLVQ